MGLEVKTVKVVNAFFKNYAYLLVDGDTREAAVVDPAWQMDVLLGELEKAEAVPRLVLLTHSHFDHVNLAGEFARRFGAQVYMHRREIERYRFSCPGLRPFEHLDVLRVGGSRLTCLHTPGHTEGGACFELEGGLLTGDTLFTEGCGVCHGAGGCPHSMFRTLQMLKDRVDRRAAVYPGHSFGKAPGKTFSYLLENNIYLNIGQEGKFVDFRMRDLARSTRKMFQFH